MYVKLAQLRACSGIRLLQASNKVFDHQLNANNGRRSIRTLSALGQREHALFQNRHIGPREEEKAAMLQKIGFEVCFPLKLCIKICNCFI